MLKLEILAKIIIKITNHYMHNGLFVCMTFEKNLYIFSKVHNIIHNNIFSPYT